MFHLILLKKSTQEILIINRKGDVKNMEEFKSFKKISKEEIEKARERLDTSIKGSDKDYYSNLLKEYEEFTILKAKLLCSKDRH